jgi:hypothetical protein
MEIAFLFSKPLDLPVRRKGDITETLEKEFTK